MKYIKIVMLLMVFSANCIAGSGSGKITMLHVDARNGYGEDGVVMFTIENRTNAPACATVGPVPQWAFSLETASGKAMLSLLLSAEARDMPVKVEGFDDCAVWPDRERPKFIRIKK